MATRIEIEITSRRDEATFTWRAAGAREPKGVADISLFPAGTDVGTVVRVDADIELDGITITAVVPAKAPKDRNAVQLLEMIAPEPEPLITQQLARKPRDDRKDRGKGRDRDRKRDSRRSDGERSDDRAPRAGGNDRPRTPAKPKLPPKPKAPRLKAGRAHRNTLLDSLPEEQKPVAQELISAGLQGVRNALAKQNEQLTTEGKPTIDEAPMLALAEQLLHKVRVAEWQDRAEAALEQAPTVDLRDLRSVVTAADGTAKDDETRALAAQLRTALNQRLDTEHNAWVDEITELLADDRVVRALHMSSRPPKAGAPLPAAIAQQLVDASNAAMTGEITPDRWGYMLDALAHSPVRRQVVPASLPTTVTAELKAIIARHAARLPEIASIFGIEAEASAPRGDRTRRRKPKPDAAPAAAIEESPATDTPATDTPPEDATASSDVVADDPTPSEAVEEASAPAEATEPAAAEATDTPEDSPVAE